MVLDASGWSENPGPLDVFAAEQGLPYGLHSRGNDPAEPVRRGHLRSRLRARQAPPHNLSDGTAEAWLPARALFRGRGRLPRGAGVRDGRAGSGEAERPDAAE